MHCIASLDELSRLAAQLRGATRFFIDTEFDSSRHGTRLSLVQLHVPHVGEDKAELLGNAAPAAIYLIDALQVATLAPLAQVLGAPEAEWVLHAGLQDVQLLCSSLRLERPPRLFDTQVAWGLLTPESGVSLAYLEYRLLGLRKMKAYQADDWLSRPLPRAQLEYAAADVATLPALEAELTRQAEVWARRGIIEQASRAQCQPEPQSVEPLSLRSFRNAWQLEPANQRALQGLISWHNQQREPPPLVPKTYLNIASRLPGTLDELQRIKGVPRALRPARAKLLLQSMQGPGNDADALSLEPAGYATYREIQVEAQLTMLRAALCTELHCAPDLALPGRILKRMEARVLESGRWLAALDCLTGWRAELMGEALRQALINQGAVPQ